MKLTGKTLGATAFLVLTSLLTTNADELELLETLRPAARHAVAEFDQIEAERKKELKQAAAFIRRRLNDGKPTDVTFICTHNSRRSHLSQLWAQTAAQYYGVSNVTTFSGGTEVSACNIRTIRALRRAGFSIVQSTGGTNPVYLAQFSENKPAVKLYSKVFSTTENPQKDFAALFCCDSAAASCPVVPGAALRLPVLYLDPKVSDNSPREQATYDERSRQIAREMFFLISQVNVRN